MIEQWQRQLRRFKPGILLASVMLMLCACGQPEAVRAPASSAPDLHAQSTMTSAPVAEQVVAAETAPPTVRGAPAASPAPRPDSQQRFADSEPQTTPTPLPNPTGACPEGCESPPAGCVVKGVIPKDGYKVYLLPGQLGYATAQIDPRKGERWFCTIDEARTAGWIQSKVLMPASRLP
jgi:hypothetical protein